MTFNVISDIHCDYDFDTKKVFWNIRPYHDFITKETLDENKIIFENIEKCIKNINSVEVEIVDRMDEFSKINFRKRKIDSWYRPKHPIYSLNTFFKKIKQLKKFLSQDINDKNECLKHFDIFGDLNEFINHLDLNHTLETYLIRICIHRKYCNFDPSKLQSADYLLVCGDLGHSQTYKFIYDDLKEKTRHLFKDVFFIKGNHDYWWFPNPGQSIKEAKLNLEDRYIEKDLGDNCILLGCTLHAPVSEEHKYDVLRMNDYNYIPNWSVNKVNQMYQEDSNWLREKVKQYNGKKIIIMTHHLPRKELIEGRYSKSGGLNAAYTVLDGSCDDIKPNVWCCGHSHAYVDMTIDNVRYIRNPIGYREFYGYLPSEVKTDNWYNTVIEV